MIVSFISLILDGIISIYTNNTLFVPLFTLTSLIILYKKCEKREDIYYFIVIIVSLIYDFLYTDIFLINTVTLLIICFIIKILNIYLSHKLTSNLVKLLFIIVCYRVITYLILIIINYIDFKFIVLFKSIYTSIILNVIYMIIITIIDKKISSK